MNKVSNASDPKQVKKAARDGRTERETYLAALENLLATDDGKLVFWSLLSTCKLYSATVSSDSHMTYFNEGERNIGLQILRDIAEASPSAYLAMIEKQLNEEKQ